MEIGKMIDFKGQNLIILLINNHNFNYLLFYLALNLYFSKKIKKKIRIISK